VGVGIELDESLNGPLETQTREAAPDLEEKKMRVKSSPVVQWIMQHDESSYHKDQSDTRMPSAP